MKRIKSLSLPLLSFMIFALSSCSEQCCDCSGVAGLGAGSEVCQDEYEDNPAQGYTWSEWRDAAISVGCDC